MYLRVKDYVKFGWGVLIFLSLVTGLWQCRSPNAATVANDLPEEQQETSSLLWRINSNGEGTEPAYLFGTIHIIAEEDYFFTPEMSAALDSSEILALEFNLDDAMELGGMMNLMSGMFMEGDTTLDDLYSEEEYEIVADHFDEMGLPMMFLNKVKPMFLTIFASGDMFGFGSEDGPEFKSYELELVQMAKSEGLELAGLETMEDQLNIFESIPYKAQAKMLLDAIQLEEGSSTFILDTLIHYYRMQDLSRLEDLINSSAEIGNYQELLLDDRNRNWIPVMEELMNDGRVFFAVGAGHLPGENGVINLLRKEGYNVSPIPLQLE